jgi:hypothetical protein
MACPISVVNLGLHTYLVKLFTAFLFELECTPRDQINLKGLKLANSLFTSGNLK